MIEYRSTIARMEEFIESSVWADMLAELQLWQQAAESEFITCANLHQLGNIQGRIEALAYLRGLPHALLGFLKDRAEEGVGGAVVEGTEDMEDVE